jgi:hypothetical protein
MKIETYLCLSIMFLSFTHNQILSSPTEIPVTTQPSKRCAQTTHKPELSTIDTTELSQKNVKEQANWIITTDEMVIEPTEEPAALFFAIKLYHRKF